MILTRISESLEELLFVGGGTRWMIGNVFEVNKLEDITQE